MRGAVAADEVGTKRSKLYIEAGKGREKCFKSLFSFGGKRKREKEEREWSFLYAVVLRV